MNFQQKETGIRLFSGSLASIVGVSLLLMLFLGLSSAQAEESEQPQDTAQAQEITQAQEPEQQEATEEEAEAPVFTGEIIVTSQRQAIKSAQEVKLEAIQIVDSVVATDIEKLPDRSVTEALQRIPGVTITHFQNLNDPEHFSVEGAGVMVRGLSMVRSELNGRDSFTADGGRALSFQDVPPELMQRVDVYKNQTADLIEGGIGGTVNLITKKPFDYDGMEVAATVEGNYGNFVDELSPAASVLFSNRWAVGGGEIGVLFDLAYSEAATRTDGIYARAFFPRTDIVEGETVYFPRGADWRTYTFDRTRKGAYGVFQWRVNDEVEMAFQIFNSQYEEYWDEYSMFMSNWEYAPIPYDADSVVYDAGNRFISGRTTGAHTLGHVMGQATRFAERDSETTDYSYTLNWRPNYKWQVDFDLQRVDSTVQGLDSTIGAGLGLPYMDLDFSGSRPIIGVPTDHMADVSNYYLGFTMDNQRDNAADEFAARLDATLNGDNQVFHTFKFGLRMTDTDSENHDTSYDWQPIYQDWMWWWALPPDFLPEADPSQMTFVELSDFYRGGATYPGGHWSPAMWLAEGFPQTYLDLHQEAGDSGNYWCCYGAITVRDINDPQYTNIQNEKTRGVYAMSLFGWYDLKYPISGNIGVRVVETENSTEGWVVYPTTITDSEGNMGFYQDPEQISVSNKYTNVLPSLNLRVNFRDNLLLRFAASRAISRPNFGDMQAYRILSAALPPGTGIEDGPELEDFILTADLWDNPMLEPVESDQFDLSFEWYFSEYGGMAHANLFYKNIDGIISRAYTNEEYGGWDYAVTQPTNNSSGSLKGFELGLKKFFDGLPGFLRGFGVDLTYTYIDSDLVLADVNQPIDTDGSTYGDLPLIGISEQAYNATLIYELGRFSSRLAYNWRSEWLMSIGANGYQANDRSWRLPVYTDDYGQLDASLQFRIAKSFSIALMAINLTNAETTLIAAQNAAGDHKSMYVNDTTYILRASFTLSK